MRQIRLTAWCRRASYSSKDSRKSSSDSNRSTRAFAMSAEARRSPSCHFEVQNQACSASTSFLGLRRMPPLTKLTSTGSPSSRWAALATSAGSVSWFLRLSTASEFDTVLSPKSDFLTIGKSYVRLCDGFGGSVNSPLLAFQEVGYLVVERLWLL